METMLWVEHIDRFLKLTVPVDDLGMTVWIAIHQNDNQTRCEVEYWFQKVFNV